MDKDGDGIVDSTYRLPGDSTYLDYLPLTHSSNSPEPVIPFAEFSSNVISGNAPLDVSFTDISTGNPAAWYWNFGDGTNSADKNPVHTYSTAGTYIVTLTVSNANGTASKTTIITVNEEDNGGSNHRSGGSSGGGGGGSPEPAKNVKVKVLAQVFITNGKAVKFDFTKNATCVVSASFDAIKNVGKTTTIVEELKNKSALVSELPEGEVYKSFNVWVGNSGYATSKNIENPVICFKVEKSWMQNKSVDQDSITLNRYEDEDEHGGKDGTWTRLTANLTGEDDKFLYFTSEVPGFSFFAITGETKTLSEENIAGIEPEQEIRSIEGEDIEIKGAEGGQSSGQEKNTSAPGFEISCGIACILVVSLYKRK